MSKKEVIKHTGAVHIENKINLVQRQAWNVLLAQAYDDLPKQDRFQVSAKDLCDILNIDRRNIKHLKDALESLVGCKVKWNVLDKDKETEWGVATLLADAVIKNGTVYYSYAPSIREKLHHPRMYARINLLIQSRFTSKHTQALYELCKDYFNPQRHVDQTPWLTLDQFRKLMGVKDDEYTEFKILNKWVIKDPIIEINEKSDIHITVEYERKKRKVVQVKFRTRVNPNKDNFPSLPAGSSTSQPAAPNKTVVNTLTNQLIAHGIDPAVAKTLVESHTADAITIQIEHLGFLEAKGKAPATPGAWLRRAIENNYTLPKGFVSKADREKAAAVEAATEQRVAKDAEQAANNRAKETAEYDRLYAGLSDVDKQAVDTAAIERLNAFARGRYEKMVRDKKTLDESPAVAALITDARNTILHEKYLSKQYHY